MSVEGGVAERSFGGKFSLFFQLFYFVYLLVPGLDGGYEVVVIDIYFWSCSRNLLYTYTYLPW